MEVKKNITSIFMVPTLRIDRELLKKNNFINAYVQDKGKDLEYEDAIFLLFKPEDIDIFRDFLEKEYERSKNIIEDYDYKGGFVVIVYHLNPFYKKDFDIVKTGKYSKTSYKFQALFPKTFKIVKGGISREEVSLQYRIFNRTEDLIKYWEDRIGIVFTKDLEVWEGFHIENEILDIKKIQL